jgi:hypothetical protein
MCNILSMSGHRFAGEIRQGPWRTVPLSKARGQLGDIARWASTSREDIALTDNGHITAVVTNPHVVDDLREEVAYLKARLRELLTPAEHDALQRELSELYPHESAAGPGAVSAERARAAVFGDGSAA